MHLVGAIFIFLLLAHFAGERKALKQMRMPFFIRWKLRQQAEKNEVDESTNCDFKCICQMVGKKCTLLSWNGFRKKSRILPAAWYACCTSQFHRQLDVIQANSEKARCLCSI